MARYFYSDQNGLPAGPVEVADLKRLLHAGFLTARSRVAQEGVNEWVNILKLLPDLPDIAGNSSPQTTPKPATSEDFPALRFLAAVHKVVAVVALVSGLIGVVIAFATSQVNPLAVVAAIVWTTLAPFFLWGSGELILLFLSIERNTRRRSRKPPVRGLDRPPAVM
jgi:hypothetical protein